MRLNPDCIRDILFTVEEKTGFASYMMYSAKDNNFPLLSKYSREEVLYHIKQLELSGLLTKVSWYLNGGCMIHDLSPLGHEFLADVRSDTNWNKTKDIAKTVGSTSLSAIKEIATNVLSELIKSKF